MPDKLPFKSLQIPLHIFQSFKKFMICTHPSDCKANDFPISTFADTKQSKGDN